MSDTSSNDVKKPMEQPNDDLSEAMGQLSVTSNKTSKNLSDMPVDVVGLIIERSDYKQQLILRKVSKSFRALVDKLKPSCKILYVHSSVGDITCYYNSERVDSQRYKRILEPIEGDYKYQYKKTTLDDLAFTLKNPKLQLESFSAIFHDLTRKNFPKFRDILDSIGHQLSAKRCKFRVSDPDEHCSILPYLKPGVLEKITVSYDSERNVSGLETMKQIALLDQWKQAKELELVFSYEGFPMEYATHFERFHFNETMLYGDLLARIRDCLCVKLSNFQYCLIETRFSIDVRNHSAVGRPGAPNDRTECVCLYNIPNSEYYLEFMFFENSVEIRKMKRS